MGRQEEPSQEELEFIFDCMARGLSPNEILYEMQDTEFPLRGREFISRKRRYFDAAKKVLQVQVESTEDPLIVDARRQHFRDIQETGKAFIDWLEKVRQWATEAFLWEKPSVPDHLTGYLREFHSPILRDPLFECLRAHIPDSSIWDSWDQLSDKFGNYMVMEMLIREGAGPQAIELIWDNIDPAVDFDSVSPAKICQYLAYDIGDLTVPVRVGVTYAISQGVFPGICPACPSDYKTQTQSPP